jgi:type IV pilus assembly protein PilC
MRPQDKLALISNLGTMLSAGIPILEAVETLEQDSKGPSRKFLKLLVVYLNEGKPISEAMKQMPQAFDPVTINIVMTAEEAGTLTETLKDLEVSLKNDMAFRDQLRTSLTYPAFIFVILLGVLLLMLTFVVPRIAKVFTGLHVQLPPTTKALINVSDFLVSNYKLVAVGAFVFIAFMAVLIHTQRRAMVNALLQLPFLTSLGREIDLTRFTRSLGLLLKAGVPIGEALKLSREVIIKKEIRRMADNMIVAINEGKPLSDGLEQSKRVTPTIMRRLIDTAERSGSLEASMQNLSEHFQTRVSHRLKMIATLVEPVMIVVVGLLVGGIMLSIIAPIYNLINQVRLR